MRKLAVLFSAILLLGVCLGGTVSAFAGASNSNVVSEASVSDGQINTGDFFVEGDVSADDSDILFGERGNAETSNILAKTKINDLGDYGVGNVFSASATLSLTSLAEKGSFSVCFGMGSLSAGLASEDSVELKFFEDGGIWFAVYEHIEEGIVGTLLEKKQYSDMQAGGTVNMEIVVTTNKGVTLKLNNQTVLADVNLKYVKDVSGYFGIFSEGKNKVRVGDLRALAYTYDTPENFNYLEKFDNNEYNGNVFYSESKSTPLSPSKLAVEDGKLHFSNTAGAFFTTRYQYSNFELQFELSDLKNKPEYDENNNLIGLISGWFGIAFGIKDLKQIADYTVQQEMWLQFEGVPIGADHTTFYEGARFVMLDDMKGLKTQPMGFNLWDPEFMQDKNAVDIRLTVIDGYVTLYMKFADEEDWGKPQFECDVGYTPTGYIRIFTYGETSVSDNGLAYNSAGNFKIDNISIKNKDYEGVQNIVDEPPFKSNVIGSTPDYEYEDKTDDNDLLGNRVESGDADLTGKGCSSLVAGSAVGGVTVLALSAALCVRRKNK